LDVSALTISFKTGVEAWGRLHDSGSSESGEGNEGTGEVHGCNVDSLPGRPFPFIPLGPVGVRRHRQ
jgi:hypothetical protein